MKVSFLQRVADLIAPRTCVICGQRLMAEEQGICAVCNLHLPRTDHLLSPYDNELAKCFWGRIRHIEKAAALIYHHSGQPASFPIYSLKYRHNRNIGILIGRLMAKEFMSAGFFDDIDAIIPVPLAPKREKKRGYNQSEVIAEGIQQICPRPIYKGVIIRDAFTGSQTTLDRWERNDNVEHAFRLADAQALVGKHVLFIDDIITTGATITACAALIDNLPGIRISVAAIGFADNSH